MREVVERSYFHLCLTLGRLLRSGRYATAQVVSQGDALRVRKRRHFYAPLLVRLGGPLFRLLDTGVRVLPQRSWEERERLLYQRLYEHSLRVDLGGTLILPYLAGETLAALLDNPATDESARQRAIELAIVALAKFHRQGLTHGDAMAENVLIDLNADAARWFDFETIHEPSRPIVWRRADDVRALLATCLLRTHPERSAEILRLLLDAYADESVIPMLAASFATVVRRPLAFHLAQAGLSWRRFREIARLLRARLGE